MKNFQVSIVDYGVGNLLSVERAFSHCGAKVEMAETPSQVERAERLVLPGVGAFHNGMKGLEEKRLSDAIRNFAAKERPFLGICLGMQMMMSVSEEFGMHQGLNLIPGKVRRIPSENGEGKVHKIPSIGWYGLENPHGNHLWKSTLLHQVEPGAFVYFVHSYFAVPEDQESVLANYAYNGLLLTAVVQRGPLFGCQFHPEKSGLKGLEVIKTFLSL